MLPLFGLLHISFHIFFQIQYLQLLNLNLGLQISFFVPAGHDNGDGILLVARLLDDSNAGGVEGLDDAGLVLAGDVVILVEVDAEDALVPLGLDLAVLLGVAPLPILADLPRVAGFATSALSLSKNLKLKIKNGIRFFFLWKLILQGLGVKLF